MTLFSCQPALSSTLRLSTITSINDLINRYNYFRLRGVMGSLMTLTPNLGYLYGLMLGNLVPVNLIPWFMVGPSLLFSLFSWKG